MKRLSDKTALVSGAGAGIGEAICKRYCAEGGTVVAMDRDEAQLKRVVDEITAAGGTAHAQVGDVTVAADRERIILWTQTELGRIDVLCNVAGFVDGGTLVEASEENLQNSLDINVKSMHSICRRVVPLMVEAGGGSVINIASVAGPFAVPQRGVYSVTKAAVLGLTKSLAADFVRSGVRVNAICPGTVESPSWHARVNDAPDPAKALKAFIARQPMGRVGQPEEIAALAAYLAADESAYMTGQAIVIDGGMTM